MTISEIKMQNVDFCYYKVGEKLKKRENIMYWAGKNVLEYLKNQFGNNQI